jgi:hypothetical protein
MKVLRAWPRGLRLQRSSESANSSLIRVCVRWSRNALDRVLQFGRLLSAKCCNAGGCAATGQPGRARRLGSAVFAALRLPCAARGRGPVAQLATLTAFAALEQSRRVRARSALRARAPAPVLLGASHARRARPGCPVAELVVACRLSNTDAVAGKAAGGAWAGRIGAAEKRRGPGRARSALRELTRCRCLSVESEANAASSVTGPGTRASQGTRSEAKGKPSEPRPGPARRLARRCKHQEADVCEHPQWAGCNRRLDAAACRSTRLPAQLTPADPAPAGAAATV